MVEENSYVVDNDGTLIMKPSVLELVNDKINSDANHNNHIVYIFINKDVPGIKFYNLNLDTDTNKKYIEFITKRNFIFETKWNYLINYPNESMIFKSENGNIKVDTYIVNKNVFFGILKNIKKNENNGSLIEIRIKNKKI